MDWLVPNTFFETPVFETKYELTVFETKFDSSKKF